MEQTKTNVTIKNRDGRMVAFVSGEIDHHSARDIRRAIDDEYLSSGATVLALDMSRVRFMDSSGLGLILGRFTKVSALGGKFCVLDPSESVKKVLDIAGAGRLIDIKYGKSKPAS